jgi:ABC-2 type transport system permease protein
VIAIVDRTGRIAKALKDSAAVRNAAEVYHAKTNKKLKPAYLIELIAPNDGDPLRQRIELSERVRRGELQAFVELGKNIIHPNTADDDARIGYYARSAVLDDVRQWIVWPINNYLRKIRLADAGIEEERVKDLFRWISVEGMELVSSNDKANQDEKPRHADEIRSVAIPMAMTMLMFMLVMIGATPLLSAVMEEKTQRIAEVVLGSVTPFEFMMGKILGGVSVALTASAVYIVVAVLTLAYFGMAGSLSASVIAWFVVYMVLAILMVGAMQAALGSLCNDAKDAQALAFPGLIPVLIPLFVMVPIIKEPLSTFATGMSFFPLWTPILMTLRLSTAIGIPTWQPWVGLVGVLAFTILFVWIGARIFRVGILMRGKPPRLGEIVRLAVRG